MKRTVIRKLHARLEQLVHNVPQTGTEFWFARDLQNVLGYKRWHNFARVIEKAKRSCDLGGHDHREHFLEVGHAAPEQAAVPDRPQAGPLEDYVLTRYACYLIAQHARASKDPVAYAQAYFAGQARGREMIDARLADEERLAARKKLSRSEKALSGSIYEHVEREGGFSRIRTKGDQALFGGVTTRQMKQRLRVPKGRAMADFLPLITIKAKDLAAQITNVSIRRDYLHTEAQIAREHIKNNRHVRRLLHKRRILPEVLPAAEDIKKIERRLLTEQRQLPQETKLVPGRHAIWNTGVGVGTHTALWNVAGTDTMERGRPHDLPAR